MSRSLRLAGLMRDSRSSWMNAGSADQSRETSVTVAAGAVPNHLAPSFSFMRRPLQRCTPWAKRPPSRTVPLRKEDYSGGNVGCVVNQLGLYVKKYEEAQAKWKAAGLTWEKGNTPGQGFLTGPDNVRVEIYENTALSTPMAMHHIHLFVPDPLAAQKWYMTNFGATSGKRGQ